MSAYDPTDPWGDVSPWDVAGQTQPDQTPESPVTNNSVAVNPAPNPFKIGLTLKAASGYDAEWITPTIYGATADEVSERTVELINALKKHGVIELTAKAAEFTRSQFQGGSGKPAQPAGAKPSFQGGKVQYNQQPAAAPAPVTGDSCPHGRTLREGTNQKGAWAAMFCNERNKAAQCPPMWRQKDGTFA